MEIIEHSNIKSYKKNKNNKSFLTILLTILALLIGAGFMYAYMSGKTKTITRDRIISENKVTEEAMEDAIDKIYNSVLCIEVMDDNGEALSTGTGFVYDKDDEYAYVLTNAHVVSGGKNIQGLMSDNKMQDLHLLGLDTYTDLAVLRMKNNGDISVASIGTSQNTKIGNTVFAVGSPMGSDFAGTVTKGILSGKDRLIETSSSSSIFGSSSDTYIVKVLQTDAAISPGNSGGPLVNLAGDVIGINSLKLVDTEVEGMGFAIPIEEAMNYVDILEKGEEIKRPVIGVQILDMTNKYLLSRYGINIDSNIDSGVILVKVNDDYPAKKAGLQDGDIVTKIDGEEVATTAKFKYLLYKHAINEEAEITYYRNGKENTVKLKLDKES